MVERHVANVNAVGSSPITCFLKIGTTAVLPPYPVDYDKEEIEMKNTMQYACLVFVFLNLFFAAFNLTVGAGLITTIPNLIVAGFCWYGYNKE